MVSPDFYNISCHDAFWLKTANRAIRLEDDKTPVMRWPGAAIRVRKFAGASGQLLRHGEAAADKGRALKMQVSSDAAGTNRIDAQLIDSSHYDAAASNPIYPQGHEGVGAVVYRTVLRPTAEPSRPVGSLEPGSGADRGPPRCPCSVFDRS